MPLEQWSSYITAHAPYLHSLHVSIVFDKKKSRNEYRHIRGVGNNRTFKSGATSHQCREYKQVWYWQLSNYMTILSTCIYVYVSFISQRWDSDTLKHSESSFRYSVSFAWAIKVEYPQPPLLSLSVTLPEASPGSLPNDKRLSWSFSGISWFNNRIEMVFELATGAYGQIRPAWYKGTLIDVILQLYHYRYNQL